MKPVEEDIFWRTEGADRVAWHMTLLDIWMLPEVKPAQVRPGWRTKA